MPSRSIARIGSALVLMGLLGTSFVFPLHAAESLSRAEALRTAMHRLDQVRMRLAQRRAQAAATLDFVDRRRSELVREIRLRIEELGVREPTGAAEDSRLRFDMRLLGHLYAYGEKLAERIDFFELGDHRLAFFYARAEDDLRMMQALNDLNARPLLSEMDQAMDDLARALEAPLVDLGQLAVPSTKQLWARISSPSP